MVARENQIIRGKTLEEQIRSVDHILTSILRRGSTTRTVGFISPIPILWHCDTPAEDGTVMKAVVPLSCEVKSAVLYIGASVPEGLKLLAGIKTLTSEFSMSVDIKDQLTSFTMHWPVVQGGILICKVSHPLDVKEILLGFLIYPDKVNDDYLEYTNEQLVDIVGGDLAKLEEEFQALKSGDEERSDQASVPRKRKSSHH